MGESSGGSCMVCVRETWGTYELRGSFDEKEIIARQVEGVSYFV